MAPTPVTTDVVGITWEPAINLGPPLPPTLGPLPYVWAGAVATDGQAEGCSLDGAPNPFPPTSLTGRLVLIRRGTCAAADKVRNAQAAGAVGVVVYERQPGPALPSECNTGCDTITIPTVSVSQTAGEALAAWYRRYPTTAQLRITTRPRVQQLPGDGIIYFSSRGPTADLRLKPDVVAPGVYILSAGYGYPHVFAGFGQASGTSMATPHVSGAAALLRQLHPAWTPEQVKSALMTTAKVEGLAPPAEPPWTELTDPTPGSLDFGAGRIDLRQAGNPGLFLDPPSLGFGTRQGLYSQQAISLTSVAATNEVYTVTVSQTTQIAAGLVVQSSVPALTLRTGETGRLTLNVGVAPDAAPGDYEGLIWLRGATHTVHLPYWVRVVPTQPRVDVLLLDNDGSDRPGPQPPPDYAGVYTQALTSLGLTYHVLNADTDHLSEAMTLGKLLQFKTVLWVTGDNATPSYERQREADQALLRDYLNSGGRLLVSGQDFASASQLGQGVGQTLLYQGYLGATYLQDDVFDARLRGLPASPSVTGASSAPFLRGVRLDLSRPTTGTLGAGAGNQLSVDEVAPVQGFDVLDLGYGRVTPLFTALGARPLGSGTVGLAVSAEPSLTAPQPALAYRTAYLAFGLEGVNDSAGTTPRAEALGRVLNWLRDEVRVSMGPARQVGVGTAVVISGTAVSSLNDATFTRFRWDLGDGTPVQDTLRPSVVHTYARPGAYTVRLEATDSYGHQALASTTVVVVAAPAELTRRLYLPYLTAGNPATPTTPLVGDHE